ncbi:alpha/beta hydrolase [Aequorivita sp. H23M31]|uniref:Alpha/beta hydrolase n=1 Tax=Aequorivita ciconiae TaxID=2494375 RepID=A0A410G538_9FLAO|nr:alpha/beta fold hydrolase [Aequorivita sp. H23M31]QAA82325.1 alpha/beta hydrolase [Aequorivita sp. H23M31]
MIIKKNLVLNTANKKPILYDLYYYKSGEPLPLVIFSHGYKGFKDWGAWNLVAEAFAEAGFCFIKFNFSHNGGTMEQPIDFPDLEAFAENNFSLELDDLNRVLNGIEDNEMNLEQLVSKVYLIGHSRGGGTVLIKAQEDSRIDRVVTWAGVSDFKSRFHENSPEFENWKNSGITYVENSRTKQQLPHHFQFYEDFKRHEERYTISRAVKNLKIPYLIVQGEDDATVTLSEARKLHGWNPTSKLEVIPSGDHVFGAVHPWKESTLPENLRKVVDKTIDFLK